MLNKKHLICLIALLSCLLATTAMAGDLKERMKERRPLINALLEQGVVGENNQGFLEFRKAPKEEAAVKAENADRATVFKAIAQKRGTTPESVGALRAEFVAEKADPGTWLQAPDGSWYQK